MGTKTRSPGKAERPVSAQLGDFPGLFADAPIPGARRGELPLTFDTLADLHRDRCAGITFIANEVP
jgi:hypothetical protein